MSIFHVESKQDRKVDEIQLWIITFVCYILFGYVIYYSFKKYKLPKSVLRNYYQIDKKTLNKWLKFFCSDLIEDYKIYAKKRKISYLLYHQIITRLGNVNDHPIMTKKQLVKTGEGTYSSLRNSIREYPNNFGISATVFAALHKFPPNISKRILKQYQY